MSSSRENAIAELKKLIAAQRDRLDPKVLKAAERAAKTQQEGRVHQDMVPYDRDSAQAAVALFLKNHDDPQKLEQRLKALLSSKEH